MKVSVIIAVYNAEKYLAEALYSAVNQTMNADDYEVIAVNDGSTDESLKILEAYQAEYSNLKVINKENGGPSSARNLGLKEAKGEYIYFFDADDIMQADSLEALYKRITEQNADLVIAGYDIFNKAGTSNVKTIMPMLTLDTIDKYDTRILWTFALWNKLFKKSIITDNNITFPPLTNAEDGVFVFRYVSNTHKITGLDKIILHYRKAYNGIADSITTAVSKETIEAYFHAHKLIFDILTDSMINDFDNINSIDDIKNNPELNAYINEFYRKLVHLSLGQFYSKIHLLDDECADIVIKCIKHFCNEMSPDTLMLLQNNNPEIPLINSGDTRSEMTGYKYITAVLYGDDEKFINCLKSIINQNLIGIKILVPEKSRDIINDSVLYESLEFVKADSEAELFSTAMNNADTELIIFCDSNFIYSNNAFRVAVRRYMKDKYDFLTGAVYTESCVVPCPIDISNRVIEEYQTGLQTESITAFDSLLANKFFSVDFLRSLNTNINSKDITELCYKKGCYYKTANKQLTFIGSEKDFIAYLNNSTAEKLYERLQSEPYSPLKKDEEGDTKKQVCIICKADSLQNNGKILKHKIKSKAKVFEIENDAYLNNQKLTDTISESRIIVTDIPLPYLDSHNAKNGQKFIFNYDTDNIFDTLSVKNKHSFGKYDLITVSSRDIIPLCANQLALSQKVFSATGSIKAEALLCNSKSASKIIKKNKALQGKKIILYIAGNKRVDNSTVDFNNISNSLNGNQVIITTKKPDKDYSNIIYLNGYSDRELMLISDMLICDYSPAVFEYSLLNKPIVFYCPDMNINNVGFCLHYPEDLPSYLIRTPEGLKEFLSDASKHVVHPAQKGFAEKYMSCADGNSAQRLAKIINDYMEVK